MTKDMDPLKPSVLKALCARAGMRPDRKSGQNFLINRATLERIVAAVDPQPGDTILEVGAGFGTLTCALAERLAAAGQQGSRAAGQGAAFPPRAPIFYDREKLEQERTRGGGRIIAIERDRRIAPILRELVMPYGSVEITEDDVLLFLRGSQQRGGMPISGSVDDRAATVRGRKPRERGRNSSETGTVGQASGPGGGRPTSAAGVAKLGDHWKLAANLPYSITSDFLRLLFDAVGTGALPPPERAVLLLQREVVDRLVADPSQPSHRRAVGLLTILTQLHCAPRRIARVPPSHFWPAPKVESAVVVLEKWRTSEEIETLLGGERPLPRTSSSLAPQHRVFSRSTPDVFPLGKGRNARDEFLSIVRTAFGKRRGQLQRTLRSVTRDPSAALRTARIDPIARPETLTLATWVALARALHGAT